MSLKVVPTGTGSANTWAWTPSQTGNYQVYVYAKNQGDSSSEAVIGINFSVEQ
jgi:hypothetical protein